VAGMGNRRKTMGGDGGEGEKNSTVRVLVGLRNCY
jgi:hypothetical protein